MKEKKELVKKYFKYETNRRIIKRFIIISLIVLVYLSFSIGQYGLSSGILVTALTWSLFVLCTPIADAGFLIDFPIRFFTNIRMIYSEITVWGIAIALNIISVSFFTTVYSKTVLLNIFLTILTHPIPYWLIIILSAAGTFLSIYFGDELLDVITHKKRKKHQKHKHKYRLIIILFIVALVVITYYHLLHQLNISF